MLVKELMSTNVEYITPDTSIKRAAEIMKDKDIGFLPVGENDRLVGMITDRDIAIRAVAGGMDPNTAKVREVMTKDVVYCYEDQPVEEAASMMEEKQVRRLSVLNRDKRLVGICSIGDIANINQDSKLSGELIESVSAHH